MVMVILGQMNKYLKIYFLLFILFYAVIFYFRTNNVEEVTKIIIPLFAFMIFIFVLFTNNIMNRHNILLYLVFLFILIGDCIINWSEYKQLSIIPFSLAHILLAIYYILDIKFIKKDFIFLIPVLAFSALLFFKVHADIQGNLLLTVFLVYLNILNFMLWRALCYLRSDQNGLKTFFVISGSSFFYFTDVSVCLHSIYKQENLIAIIWILYPPALLFLSLMNIRQSKNKYLFLR
jgi:YhhN-like protein.